MSYGITYRNNSGDVLIDSQYSNFLRVFRSSASLSAPRDEDFSCYVPQPVYFPEPVNTKYPPLIGMRALSRSVGLGGLIGGEYDWRGFYTVTTSDGGSGPVSYSLEYEVYTLADANSHLLSGNYGMQVMDGGGNVVFDSRRQPVIIDSFHSLPTLPFRHSDWKTINGKVYLNLSNNQFIDCGTLAYYNGVSAIAPNASNHWRVKLLSEKTSSGHRIIGKYVLSYTSTTDFQFPPALHSMGTHVCAPTRSLVFRRMY